MNRLASPGQLRASLIRWSLFIVPAIVLLGYLSGMLSAGSVANPWFDALEKPEIFPAVGVLLLVNCVFYVLMGIAFAAVCAAWGSRYRTPAIIAFIAQFVLNLIWAPVFFSMHQIGLALGILIAMEIVVIVVIFLFVKVRGWAGMLLVPYLAWLLLATVLMVQILMLNPNAGASTPENDVQRIEF